MPMSSGCCHETRQIRNNAFECRYCGMVFVGVNRRSPDFDRIMDAVQRRETNEVGRHLSSMNIPVTHVDLGSMPQDVISIKSQMEQMEKALSLFSEVLKDALQT